MKHAMNIALGLILLAAGCSSYQLQGVVVEGDAAEVLAVAPGDSRIKQHPPVSGATVELTIDPESMTPKKLGEFKTSDDGRFAVPVGQLGAGFLKYDLAVATKAKGYKTQWQTVPLPPREHVLLVILEAGYSSYKPPENLIKETQRIGEQLMR